MFAKVYAQWKWGFTRCTIPDGRAAYRLNICEFFIVQLALHHKMGGLELRSMARHQLIPCIGGFLCGCRHCCFVRVVGCTHGSRMLGCVCILCILCHLQSSLEHCNHLLRLPALVT